MLLAYSPLPRGSQKPRNYRERLSYVNLETACPSIGVDHFPDVNNLDLGASGKLLNVLLDFTHIFFIDNNFGAQNERSGNGVLMPIISGSFAAGEPAFWSQKDKYQNDNTKKVPLPGVARVIPEEDLLKCGRQASHVFQLASKQPRDSRLAGQMDSIVPGKLL